MTIDSSKSSQSPRRHWRARAFDKEKADALGAALNLPSIFAQLLVQREISTPEQAEAFFNPSFEQLHDPFLMKDMDKAVMRLHQALQQKEKILIYGDYDVDGTTSVALMYDFLEGLGGRIDYYIPDRYEEGYGISEKGIQHAASNDFDLLIVLDCGIKAIERIQEGRQLGLDFIICEHHLPGEKLPPAQAILNPKRTDCTYPFKELSACGVGFKLAQAYVQHFDLPQQHLLKLLDLVVVSIACDVVLLRGENRALAHIGLKRFNDAKRKGFKALRDVARKKSKYSIGDIVFSIGPLINAAGRLGDAKDSVRLLLGKDKFAAREQAQLLLRKNLDRRIIEQGIVEAATRMIREDMSYYGKKVNIVYAPNWHKGVLGIVASRLVETFHRPAIVLSASDGLLIGSARSVHGFDIHEALQACSDYLVSFGGHKYAAGLALHEDDFKHFRQALERQVAQSISDDLLVPELVWDAEIDLKDINSRFWGMLKRFAPFGPGNMRPVFLSQHIKDTGYSAVLKQKHLKLHIKQIDSGPISGIGFNFGRYGKELKSKRPFHLCYVIEENQYMGHNTLQVSVKDMKFYE